MHQLRHARFLARLVLVWFALAVGVAVAAPVLRSGSLELVCSGSGAMKLVVKGEDGQALPLGHALDCPLCVQMDAPPPAAGAQSVAPITARGPIRALVSTRVAVLGAGPPPARGPPARS